MTSITLEYYLSDGSGEIIDYDIDLEGEEEASYLAALEKIREEYEKDEDAYLSLNDFDELQPILVRAFEDIIEIEKEIAPDLGLDDEDLESYIDNLPYDLRVEFKEYEP